MIDAATTYQLSCNCQMKLIQNDINLKFPIGTEMLNKGLQTKDLVKNGTFQCWWLFYVSLSGY